MSDEQCDLAAEQHVLGAVLIDPDLFIDIAAIVRPDDFYRPAHETLWRAMSAQAASRDPIDPALIVERLRAQGDLGRCGGAEYLHTLVAGVPSTANAPYYARIIHRYGGLRRVHIAASRIVGIAHEASASDLDDVRQRAQTMIDAAVDDEKPSGGWVADNFPSTLEALENQPRVLPTPWPDMDRHIGGLGAGRLYVIGARPGVGKSVVSLQAAVHTARRRGSGAAFASLEMSEEELHIRMLSQIGRIPHDRLEQRNLHARDWDAISEANGVLSSLPLNVLDSGTVTVHDVWHYVRSLQRRQAIHLVVVDYLQLMSSATNGKNQSRAEIVAEFSRQLKLMAQDLDVAVIAVSQLNRASTARRGGRPNLTDLRESGAIEQDADVVVLLHRDEESKRPDEMEMIIAKNRHGSTGTVYTEFHGRYQSTEQRSWVTPDVIDP